MLRVQISFRRGVLNTILSDKFCQLGYNWNIVESGIKHHKAPNHQNSTISIIINWNHFVYRWMKYHIDPPFLKSLQIILVYINHLSIQKQKKLFPIIKEGEGWEEINWFNPATFLCLSQAWTSNATFFFCSMFCCAREMRLFVLLKCFGIVDHYCLNFHIISVWF